VASPHGGNGSSTPGAQIECVRGCRIAQIVHAPVPSKNRPMTIQARMFNLLRMMWLQSASLPRLVGSGFSLNAGSRNALIGTTFISLFTVTVK
jgi:hypothetical protein